ncbi:hypothetical protein [Calothrix rhizosoleniae]|uniref:hypothetical protein n=1 Tax=Calothrix rhizosoleniae TaxID=888997 RepID=UPI000B49C714|nr:hypothetical protein [Calothrix rhizosoleniae]
MKLEIVQVIDWQEKQQYKIILNEEVTYNTWLNNKGYDYLHQVNIDQEVLDIYCNKKSSYAVYMRSLLGLQNHYILIY